VTSAGHLLPLRRTSFSHSPSLSHNHEPAYILGRPSTCIDISRGLRPVSRLSLQETLKSASVKTSMFKYYPPGLNAVLDLHGTFLASYYILMLDLRFTNWESPFGYPLPLVFQASFPFYEVERGRLGPCIHFPHTPVAALILVPKFHKIPPLEFPRASDQKFFLSRERHCKNF